MQLPNSYNYIGVFLTMRCVYNCSYCINWKNTYKEKDGVYWVENLNKIETDLPITLGGGEPSLHKDLCYILKNLKHKAHLLTNLHFDPRLLAENGVTPDRFDNDKSFAPIRVSFHPQFMDKNVILEKLVCLREMGYRTGLYCIETEENKEAIEFFKKQEGIDFQTKLLLDNTLVTDAAPLVVSCRVRELLIAPNGNVHKCHRDLYKKKTPLGNLSKLNELSYKFRVCRNGNECHPCDLKVKRDRFGKEGYCAVEQRRRKSCQD
jgi:MoaA/NifB/PqqE/SkfB family radical SAM enzyme